MATPLVHKQKLTAQGQIVSRANDPNTSEGVPQIACEYRGYGSFFVSSDPVEEDIADLGSHISQTTASHGMMMGTWLNMKQKMSEFIHGDGGDDTTHAHETCMGFQEGEDNNNFPKTTNLKDSPPVSENKGPNPSMAEIAGKNYHDTFNPPSELMGGPEPDITSDGLEILSNAGSCARDPVNATSKVVAEILT